MDQLSKAQKKVAREIIEIGIQREYELAIRAQKDIIQQWEAKSIDRREAYMRLYETINSRDAQISERYDRLSGSRYLLIIAAQYVGGIVQDEDLINLNVENRMMIERIKSIGE